MKKRYPNAEHVLYLVLFEGDSANEGKAFQAGILDSYAVDVIANLQGDFSGRRQNYHLHFIQRDVYHFKRDDGEYTGFSGT